MNVADRILNAFKRSKPNTLADVEEIHYQNGGWTLVWKYHALIEFLHDAIALFDEAGAVNFLTFAATHPERGKFAITIQRADGLTPGEKIHALQDEIEALLGRPLT